MKARKHNNPLRLSHRPSSSGAMNGRRSGHDGVHDEHDHHHHSHERGHGPHEERGHRHSGDWRKGTGSGRALCMTAANEGQESTKADGTESRVSLLRRHAAEDSDQPALTSIPGGKSSGSRPPPRRCPQALAASPPRRPPPRMHAETLEVSACLSASPSESCRETNGPWFEPDMHGIFKECSVTCDNSSAQAREAGLSGYEPILLPLSFKPTSLPFSSTVDTNTAALRSNGRASSADSLFYTPPNSPRKTKIFRHTNDDDVKVAVAKLIGGFTIRERGKVGLESVSVYGAAILMPQIARTAGWPKIFTSLAFHSYAYLFVNILLQGGLLYMIMKEEAVMDLFAGQMYLCDFGAHVYRCPGHESCTGPGGTQISAPRMYSYTTWATRSYVKASFLSLFPDRTQEIEDNVDPGEYGLESYWCRWLCCFIFMLSVTDELYLNYRMLLLIYHVPSKNEPWIVHCDNPEDSSWLSSAEVQVAGMSRFWKAINMCIVLIPKMFLWKMTAEVGVTFLMETAGIEDLIVNSVALTFVLNIDEMIFQYMTDPAKMMLGSCNDLPLYEEVNEEDISEEEIKRLYGETQNLTWTFIDVLALLPWRLILVIVLTIFMCIDYYNRHCDLVDGHFYSKTMNLPKSSTLGFLSFLFPGWYEPSKEKEHYWEMPPLKPE